jgi:hypothetical protein
MEDKKTDEIYDETQMLSMGYSPYKQRTNYNIVFKKLIRSVLGFANYKIDFTLFNIEKPCTIYDVYKNLKKIKKGSWYRDVVYIRDTINGVPWVDQINGETLWIIWEQFVRFQPRRRCPQSFLLFNLLKLHGYDDIAENNIIKNKQWTRYKL